MLAYQYTFLNQRCLLKPLGAVLGLTPMPWCGGLAVSAVGHTGTPLACCSGTPSSPFDRSSTRVLHRGASVLEGGATGVPQSSDHSDTATLCVRVV